MRRVLLLLAILSVALVGFGLGSGLLQRAPQGKLLSGIHPERDVAPTESKPFVVVLYAQNDADWCERSLRSIFAQEYESFRLIFVDDGSTDGTFARAHEFIIAGAEQHRTILIQNEAPCGFALSLQRAVSQCLDREIIVPLFASDWLPLPTALSNWNLAFQNPDVWMAFGQAIGYPSYEWRDPPNVDLHEIGKRGWGSASQTNAPCCFYSALFKQVAAKDLGPDYLEALLALSGGRVKTVREPMCFSNETKLPR